MTGFGSVVKETPDLIIRVEIKSLNSKHLDLTIRVPRQFSEKEISLRTQLGYRLQRGKVNIYIDVEYTNPNLVKRTVNKPLLLSYIKELKEIARKEEISADNILPALLQISDVMQSNGVESDGTEWPLVEEALNEALQQFDDFRAKEGEILEKEITQYVQNIQAAMKNVAAKKDERLEKLKETLRDKLFQLIEEGRIEQNRFEQELLYYSEKLDISEELVRLQAHLDLFLDTIKEEYPGKKLGFVVQEMGREINTTGSKANDAEIQKDVVVMKEELEKIKEQAFNII
jgi:uncharacterized protein (TIGR00255 family)